LARRIHDGDAGGAIDEELAARLLRVVPSKLGSNLKEAAAYRQLLRGASWAKGALDHEDKAIFRMGPKSGLPEGTYAELSLERWDLKAAARSTMRRLSQLVVEALDEAGVRAKANFDLVLLGDAFTSPVLRSSLVRHLPIEPPSLTRLPRGAVQGASALEELAPRDPVLLAAVEDRLQTVQQLAENMPNEVSWAAPRTGSRHTHCRWPRASPTTKRRRDRRPTPIRWTS